MPFQQSLGDGPVYMPGSKVSQIIRFTTFLLDVLELCESMVGQLPSEAE